MCRDPFKRLIRPGRLEEWGCSATDKNGKEEGGMGEQGGYGMLCTGSFLVY